MINFKDTFSKMKNGAVYLNSMDPSSETCLPSIPEDGPPSGLFTGLSQKKVEPMVTYYADHENVFNFMAKSKFT